jgi:hypothetical protein
VVAEEPHDAMHRLRYLLGLIVLAAAAAAGMYLWNLLHDAERGHHFQLRLEFRNARGLKAGADVRYRGVQVGVVQTVELRADTRRAIVVVALGSGRESLASSNSQFWIVTPRFGGLTGGASGLDTLVRDAYLAFVTPDPPGAPLASGGTLLGLERPGGEDTEVVLEPHKHGDLLLTLLVPENHGLAAGARVMFRGVPTGEVRSAKLAAEGTHVELLLRIDRQYRTTVTERSEFWIARPRLSGALLGGFAVEELGALLAPYVSYHTPPGQGLPVQENYRVVAAAQRPAIAPLEVPESALRASPPASRPQGSALRLAHVVYDAVEVDWLSSDDPVHREGTALLFEDGNGRLVALCPRSVCDGAYFVDDTLGSDPEIAHEKITVLLPDGPVLPAVRTWIDAEGRDLALLVIEEPPAETRGTPTELLDFSAAASEGSLQFVALQRDGSELRQEADAKALPALDTWRGACVLHGERVVALVAQHGGADQRPALLALAQLPESLRPR